MAPPLLSAVIFVRIAGEIRAELKIIVEESVADLTVNLATGHAGRLRSVRWWSVTAPAGFSQFAVPCGAF